MTQPPKDGLKEQLSKTNEITLSVMGRKSGHIVSIPVWFVLEDGILCLLPVSGSDTQWYKNVLHNPWIRIEVGAIGEELRAVPVIDSRAVSTIVGHFEKKYGEEDVKKYYSKFDVAAIAELS